MNEEEFKRTHEGEWKSDGGLRDIAIMYHYLTETYDRKVCKVCYDETDRSIPVSKEEYAKVNAYARTVRAVANGIAHDADLDVDELADCISECANLTWPRLLKEMAGKEANIVEWQERIDAARGFPNSPVGFVGLK